MAGRDREKQKRKARRIGLIAGIAVAGLGFLIFPFSALGAVLIAKSWVAARKASEPAEKSSHARAVVVVVLTLAGSLVYIFSLEYVGYSVSTALFIMIFSYLFDSSARKFWYPLVGIAVTAGIYLLFSKALHIPLPPGMLF